MMPKKVNARALANVYRALLVLLVGKALALEPTSTYQLAAKVVADTFAPGKVALDALIYF